MKEETDETTARDEPWPAWCHPTRAKDMLGMGAIFIRDMLNNDPDALYETYGIRLDEAAQSLHFVELAELRVWGIAEMVEAAVPGQSASGERLRRRIELAMKAEETPEHIHPGDAVLLLERSGLMLNSELREAVVCMSTRTYAEDGIEFSLQDQNRLRRLLGKPPFTESEAQAWLANDTAVSADASAPCESAPAASQSPIPGIVPTTAMGRIAIDAAWTLECENDGIRPTAEQVMLLLQDWATGKKYAETLRLAAPGKRGVRWLTGRLKDKPYEIDALARALARWWESRTPGAPSGQ